MQGMGDLLLALQRIGQQHRMVMRFADPTSLRSVCEVTK
jgi:hypothetical protein